MATISTPVSLRSLLRANAVERLGVTHLLADVKAVQNNPHGDIEALDTTAGALPGDLFVDCSGFRSLLLGEHFKVPLSSQRNILFNDRALAVQVPYNDPGDSIATTTRATAHHAGWFWDIGLQHRRGVGAVFSSQHTDQTKMERALDQYLRETGCPAGLDAAAARLIEFDPGYRQAFWHRNCVAIGLSAGFIEPLEASALVLVELSARRLAERLPLAQGQMHATASEFNREFTDRWEQIIEFLKLHYVLSGRDDSDYWIDHRSADSIPADLQQKLLDWQHRCPWHQDENVGLMKCFQRRAINMCCMAWASIQPCSLISIGTHRLDCNVPKRYARRSNSRASSLPRTYPSTDSYSSRPVSKALLGGREHDRDDQKAQ